MTKEEKAKGPPAYLQSIPQAGQSVWTHRSTFSKSVKVELILDLNVEPWFNV